MTSRNHSFRTSKNAQYRVGIPASTLALCFLAICVAVTSGCGSHTSKTKNTISPYDPEFDPDVDAKDEEEQKILNAEEQVPLLIEALEMFDDELYSSARDTLVNLQRQFPTSYYAPLIELRIADSHYYLGDYLAAIESYEEFLRLRPRHEAAPYARLQVANSHFAQYRGVVFDQSPLTSAEQEYEKVLHQFPRTTAAEAASTMLTRCSNLRQAHAAYVAKFYFKRGLTEASINRAKKLLEDTPLETSEEMLGQNVFEEVQKSVNKAELETLEQVRRANSEKRNRVASSPSPIEQSIRTRSREIDTEASQELEFEEDSNIQVLLGCIELEDSLLVELQLPREVREESVSLSTLTPKKRQIQVASAAIPGSRYTLQAASSAHSCSDQPYRFSLTAADSTLALSIEREEKPLSTLLVQKVDRPERVLILLPLS